ncbi:MAG: MoaD/ThiS family protein [Simkania sp.]|nr:MoaD/ThiS family protein [Simkania sp.]MCB1075940.1 MoaD/ThiS family protein [Simkania sp.]MCP5490214.1 MoaD/ThiS family protein [Chlamydiales bacterium]
MIKQIHIVYYALLRQERGVPEETVEFEKNTVRELFNMLKSLHSFRLSESQIKVAVNSKVATWDTLLSEGDSVIFIPPVAGG